jgi:hypothetical protein
MPVENARAICQVNEELVFDSIQFNLFNIHNSYNRNPWTSHIINNNRTTHKILYKNKIHTLSSH